jgi:hypothetical protein
MTQDDKAMELFQEFHKLDKIISFVQFYTKEHLINYFGMQEHDADEFLTYLGGDKNDNDYFFNEVNEIMKAEIADFMENRKNI